MAGISPMFRLPDVSEIPTLSPVSPITPIMSPDSSSEIHDESDYETEPTEGNTEVHTACIEFNVAMVDELIQGGASVDRTNAKERSCLHEMTLSYLSLDIVEQASNHKKLVDIITLLAKAGLDLNMGDLNFQTPLHYVASHCKQVDLIKVLYSAGVKVNALDRHGDAPLHLASRKGDQTNVLALIEGGANPNLKDKHGNSSLHIAAKGMHHTAALKHLIRCGGEVNKCNSSNKTPLHIAAKAGRLELVELLMGRNADPQMIDNTGQTPLHLAAGYDMAGKVCRALLRRGAKPNAIDDINNETPLHKAVRMKMTKNIETLVHNRADLSVQDVSGDTPLHKAVSIREIWAWKNLLIKGRKFVNVKNKGGKTALRLAQDINNQIAVSLMRPHSTEVSD